MDFDYDKFMTQEFPEGKFPDSTKLIQQLQRITGFLLESANKILDKNPNSLSDDQLTTLNILVANYKLRSISFINSLSYLRDQEHNTIVYDEATPNVLVRSMLENYLMFFYIFDQEDVQVIDLRYKLMDLDSLLQFKKVTTDLERKEPDKLKFKVREVDSWINMAITILEHNPLYNSIENNMKKVIEKIKKGVRDYFKPITFEKIIDMSPLPKKFTKNQYSLCSSFAHSELFGLKYSKILLQNKGEEPLKFFELSKFRLLAFSLYISSQYADSLKRYNVEFEDEKESDLIEVISLVQYYCAALRNND